jgi:hypothetical protein
MKPFVKKMSLATSSNLSDDDSELAEDQAELQAVLASQIAATYSEETTGTGASSLVQTNSFARNEVLYSEGATPLFTACEETKWTLALELIDSDPGMLTTFVKSTGTTNTTFGWALWRRLPIHEACRRQAPAWLVAAMIRAAPTTVKEKTQFGELPLHLAVEMGGSPEVVNLLIVSYIEGVKEKDNSGRIPLKLLDRSEVLPQSDYAVIHDCLERSTTSLKALIHGWETKYNDLQSRHKETIKEVNEQHAAKLAQELERQQLLEESYRKVKGHVDVYKEDRIQLEGKLGMFTSEIDKWKKGWEARDETIKQLEAKVVEKEAEKTGLNAHIAEQDIRVSTLQDRIRQLEDDLVNITQFQSETVMQALSSAQTNLNKMIGANHALQGMLIGQTKGLTMLLQQRGIASPAMNVPPTAPEITRDSIVEEIDPDEVAEAAAVSAMRALKTNDTGGSSDYDEEEERLETFDEDDEDEYYDDRSSLGEQTLD